MKPFTRMLLAVSVGLTALALYSQTADAGRLGGPASAYGTVPAGESYYFDLELNAGENTLVGITGNGQTILNLYVYDTDGHVVLGTGKWDRKVAVISVYRAGFFRIVVQNMGQVDNSFMIGVN
jgi:hypothetical protein